MTQTSMREKPAETTPLSAAPAAAPALVGPPPRPGFRWAIASVICSLVGMLIITAPVAIGLGIAALAKNRRAPLTGQRPSAATQTLAWMGIVGGAIYCIVILVVGSFSYLIFTQTQDAHDDATAFLADISRDSFTQAKRYAPQMTIRQMQGYHNQIARLGELQDLTLTSRQVHDTFNQRITIMAGTATFANGKLGVQIQCRRLEEQPWVIQSISFW